MLLIESHLFTFGVRTKKTQDGMGWVWLAGVVSGGVFGSDAPVVSFVYVGVIVTVIIFLP